MVLFVWKSVVRISALFTGKMNRFTSSPLFFLFLRIQVDESLEEYEDEFAELEEEDYNDLLDEQEETDELDQEKEELKEEAQETEEEINEGDYSTSSNGADDIYQEEVDDVFEQEEEILEEEYYEEEAAWYWDEYPSSYDDEVYDDGYWVRLKYFAQRLNHFEIKFFLNYISNAHLFMFLLPFSLKNC